MTRPADIIVVPHTHWDREWYEPFQRFRLRLVALLDEVFDRMERDPRQRFTLDGQLAAVDDYLEVRPERREQVIAGKSNAAAHDHHFRIEDVQQIGDSDPEKLRGVIDHVHRQLVAVVGGLIHGLSRNALQVAIDVLRQPALATRLDLLACPEGDVGP